MLVFVAAEVMEFEMDNSGASIVMTDGKFDAARVHSYIRS